jgi:hypothetical protein
MPVQVVAKDLGLLRLARQMKSIGAVAGEGDQQMRL